MARVAIVVVTYRSGEVIGPCLDSFAHLPDIEVIVVDNASTDAGPQQVRDRNIRLIANPKNAGFAAAVNQGVRATEAPLILLLNPDIRLQTGLEPLIACFDNPKIGGAGGLLIGHDGQPQTGFMARSLPTLTSLTFEVVGFNHLWPNNPANWHYRCLQSNPMTPTLVEQPAGAFFMFRRSAWQQLEGFDERFWPVWFEDVDFCAGLKSLGFAIQYEPSARAIHEGGHSVGAIPHGIREKYWYGSLLKYAAKRFGRLPLSVVCLSVVVGAGLRAARAFPQGGLRVFPIYGSVMRLALAHLRDSISPRGRV